MREFHHIGVPTTRQRPGEVFLERSKLYVTEPDAFRIEWLRFLPGSPLAMEIQTQTHVAYKVDNIKEEIKGQVILREPFSPMPGLTIAFILHEGVPVELMQMDTPASSTY